ncbi:MAG: hypothetical protein SNF68_06030 [Rikenellaceae bacterium]
MFTTYPENYESLYSELIYSYSTTYSQDDYAEEEGDITIYIVDSTSDEIIGVKRFYSTSTAEINVAPIIRSFAYPNVVTAQSGFVTDSNSGTVAVMLVDSSDQVTESRRFTLSRSEESEVGLLSSLPVMARTMTLGESELLTFRVDPQLPITVEQRQYIVEREEAVAVKSYSIEAQISGFATFNIVAEALEEQLDVVEEQSLDSIELSIYQSDELVEKLRYIIVDSPVDPIRLAWISSRGSIEHYTFPVVTQRSYQAGVSNTLTISSAFETYAVRRAIAEIVESPKVWIAIDTGGYLEVTVESEAVELAAISDIGCVELKISYSDE